MNNYVQPGKTLTLIAPNAVTSGSGVLVGSIFGVATATAAQGANVECITEDVVDIAKTAGQAVTQGQLIYWDNTNMVATTTSATGKLIGVATQAAAAGAATARVKLTGQVS